jgi:UDP-2,3-diacylglucosamine hydrolase
MRSPGRWTAVFAADLHLRARDAAGIRRAVELLDLCAARAERLYLLGDVFDLWTSRALLRLDEMQELYHAFRRSAAAGLRTTFLPGNRDFNLTPDVGAELGFEVAEEEITVELDGVCVHLLHGDGLLLNDVAYQRMKVVLRSFPLRFLARHLPGRLSLALARRLQGYSRRAVAHKPAERMGIVPAAVEDRFRRHRCAAMVCGHVHRGERRRFGAGRELLVLPAFLEEARFLALSGGAFLAGDLSGSLVPFEPSGESAATG